MKPAFTALALPQTRTHAWWQWPNVLSLDAPVLALVWQEAFAQVMAVELNGSQRVLLAVCTWLAYSGDRLLDARRLPTGPIGSARHALARQHAGPLTFAWLLGAALAVGVGLQLLWREVIAGAAWLAVLGGYFALQHAPRLRARAGRWKEPMAGAAFAGGTLFFVTLHGQHDLPFILAAAAWAGLCVMNCLAIAGWDRPQDAAMGQPSLARHWPGMERALPWLALALAAMALGAATMDARWLPLALALGASAAALLALAHRPEMLSLEARRVWADAVLLTPILFLL